MNTCNDCRFYCRQNGLCARSGIRVYAEKSPCCGFEQWEDVEWEDEE